MKFAVIKGKSLLKITCLVMCGIIITAILGGTGAYAVFFGSNGRKLPIYSVEKSEKEIAISFDCAWGVDYTDKLLEIMQTEQIKCTFFMVEFWAKKYPEYVKKIDDFGHEIGTHSATHPKMSTLTREKVVQELTTSCKAIEDITLKKVEVFRAPFGDYNDQLIETASQLNLFTIQWDVDSLDWKNLTSSQIYERVTKRVKNGSIVLFHNNGLHTAEAISKIIPALKKEGFKFTTIGNLIYRENFHIDVNGRQIKNN